MYYPQRRLPMIKFSWRWYFTRRPQSMFNMALRSKVTVLTGGDDGLSGELGPESFFGLAVTTTHTSGTANPRWPLCISSADVRTKHTCTSKDIERKVCRTTVVPLCRVGKNEFHKLCKLSKPQITHDGDRNFWHGARFPDSRGKVGNASRMGVCAGALGTSTRAGAFVSSKACQDPLAFQVPETIAECHQINFHELDKIYETKTVGEDVSMHTPRHMHRHNQGGHDQYKNMCWIIFPFFLLFHFWIFSLFFSKKNSGTLKTKKNRKKNYCKNDHFPLWKFDFRASVDIEILHQELGMAHLRVPSAFIFSFFHNKNQCFFFFCFLFSCFSFTPFFLLSSKYMSSLAQYPSLAINVSALVGAPWRCGILTTGDGRAGVGLDHGGESMIQLPGVRWRLLAC